MSAASDLLNTIVNSLSMIDRGFTVTLTVQPHNWDGDDYNEEEEELPEIPDIAEQTIADIREFSKTIDSVFTEQSKEKLLNSAVEAAKRFDPESETLKDILGKIEADSKEFFKDIDKMVGKKEDPSWPKVGDNVWYKTKKRNYACGHVKVVCHNTIQLENLVTLERKDCLASPFEVGEQVWFIITGKPECGIVEALNSDNARLHVKNSIMQMPYPRLFDTLDDLLDYLRASVYE